VPGKAKNTAANATGPFALVGSAEDLERDRREQSGPRLFDLLADPAERKNVAAENPEVVARLRAKLDEQKAKGVAQPLPR
jgi:hypothetical protein